MKRSIRELSLEDRNAKRQKIHHEMNDAKNPFQQKTVKKREQKEPSSFYSVMAQSKTKSKGNTTTQLLLNLNTEDQHERKERRDSIYPNDISLKSKIIILSPVEIPWYSSSFTDTEISPECAAFRDATRYYTFPSSISIPTQFQQSYTGEVNCPITKYFDEMKTQWEESFLSAFMQLRGKGSTGEFFCIFEKYYMAVKCQCDNVKERPGTFSAIISPSSRALRSDLLANHVGYHLPLDEKNGIAYYDSLDPDQHGQQMREKYEQTSVSQLVITGEENLKKLIQVLIRKFNNDYRKLSFYLPRIAASYSFDHSTCERIPITKSGSLTRTINTDTREFFRIELQSDAILPSNICRIYECLHRYCPHEEEVCEISLTTIDCTKTFNIPTTGGYFKEKESLYLSRISLFSSGKQFLLEHK